MQMYSSRKWNHLLCLITCGVMGSVSSSAFAATVFKESASNSNTWFAGAGGGISWVHFPSNTSVGNGMPVAPPSNQDLFSIQTLKDSNVQFDVGYRWVNNNRKYFPYTNVYFQYRSYINDDIKGSVEQFSLPEFTNYDYEMTYSADLLTINGKFDLVEYKKFMPYVAAGIGLVMNSVYDYSESPTANVTPRTSPGYTTNNTNHLALTLGAGIDYILTENYWITLGYEHVFQGSVRSGPGLTTWSGTSLDFGNVKMDTVFVNFTMNLPTLA
jgi:opacity protein-like surface antigen